MLDFARMIIVALGIWGHTPSYQITYNEIASDPRPEVLAYAEVRGAENPIGCNITFIPSRYEGYSASLIQDIVTHEVGHCIGLIDHLPANLPGLMRAFISNTGFTGYDRLRYWWRYPAPHQRRIVGVSYD